MEWFLKSAKAIWSWVQWVLSTEDLPQSNSPKKTTRTSFLKGIFSSEGLEYTTTLGSQRKKSFLNRLFAKEQLPEVVLQNTPCKKRGFIRYIFSSEDLGKDRPNRNDRGGGGL